MSVMMELFALLRWSDVHGMPTKMHSAAWYGFPASDVYDTRQKSAVLVIKLNVLGLLGVDSPLPAYCNKPETDGQANAWQALIHHIENILYQHLYALWKKYRPIVNAERYTKYLHALWGHTVQDMRWFRYFAHKRQSLFVLQCFLSHYLESARVIVEPFYGRWQPLEPSQGKFLSSMSFRKMRSICPESRGVNGFLDLRLPASQGFAETGRGNDRTADKNTFNRVLGSHVWVVSNSIAIHIYADQDVASKLLPRGKAMQKLRHLLDIYLPLEIYRTLILHAQCCTQILKPLGETLILGDFFCLGKAQRSEELYCHSGKCEAFVRNPETLGDLCAQPKYSQSDNSYEQYSQYTHGEKTFAPVFLRESARVTAEKTNEYPQKENG